MSQISSENSTFTSPDHAALPAHASPSSTGLPDDASQHPEKPKKSSWLRIVILLLVIGSVIGFVTYRIMHRPAPAAGGPGGGRRGGGGAGQIVPVAFDVATLKTMPISLSALGTVTAYNTVTLKSRVDGQILRVNFTEGQRVRQGQLLVEVDPRPYQATLAVAQGNLTRDQANAALAQSQAQRYQQLYAAGVVSKEQTQQQEATAGQAQGTLAADRAAVQQAQVNVNYTRVTSPINGVVGLRQVDVGNIVTANSTTGLVVITQVNPIAVIFTLPEDQVPQVLAHMRGGRKLAAEAWDRSNTEKLATGSLLTVDNQIDTTTGTAKLKAVFANTDNALFPNQFVNIHLVLENRTNALVIPSAAVQTGNNGNFVYVIDRSKGQANPAPGAGGPGGGGRGGRGGNGGAGNAAAAPGGAPAGGPGGGNTEAASSGGGAVGGGPGGSGGAAPAGGATGPGMNGAGMQGGTLGAVGGPGGAAGGRRGGGAGGGNMNFPVKVVNVTLDSTQGSDVIIRGGLQPGQQVVTDGQEKLQDGSRVVPRPSAEMMAARTARGGAEGGAPAADAANAGGEQAGGEGRGEGGGRRGGGDAARPTDSTGLTGSRGPNSNRDGAPRQPGEGRRRNGPPPAQ